MSDRDDLRALLPVTEAFESLGVEYYIGGSVASSMHGVARSTIDIDLVADLRMEQVAALATRLVEAYYVDAGQIRQAIERRRAFNLIHLSTMYKIDVFMMGARPFDVSARNRATRLALTDDSRADLPVASPEDTVLSKLEWFRAGGESSERQWSDVVGVLQVQEAQLDRAYLSHWAARLGVDALLSRAWAQAHPGEA